MRAIAAAVLLPFLAACHAAPPPSGPSPFATTEFVAATWRDLSSAYAAGATVRRTMLQVVQHNLANVDTPGFKRSRVDVSTLPYTNAAREGEAGARGEAQVGSGPYVRGITIVHTPGVLECSQRVLDLAIDGESFLVVQLPGGSLGYTRDGRLHLDAGGRLVNGSGDEIQPGVRIPLGSRDIAIDREGRVCARLPESDKSQVLGQLHLASFVNPEGLRALRDNVFAETSSSGVPVLAFPGQAGLGLLQQGFIERSNVEVLRELMLWHALTSVLPGEPAVPPMR